MCLIQERGRKHGINKCFNNGDACYTARDLNFVNSIKVYVTYGTSGWLGEPPVTNSSLYCID